MNALLHTQHAPARAVGLLALGLLLAACPRVQAAHSLIASERGANAPDPWLGVHMNGRIELYSFLGAGRTARPFKTLELGETADEVIFSEGRLGVRTGRMLRFLAAENGFRPLPKFDHRLPEGTSELVLAGDRLGVRTGQQVRFYDITKGYRPLPRFDFEVPVDVGELLIARNPQGNWLGVRVEKELTFYNIDRGYEPHPGPRFTVPFDTEDLVVAGPQLLVKRQDTVEVHDFSHQVLAQPRLSIRVSPLALPEVRSLRGIVAMATGEGREALPFRIWARGPLGRTESLGTGPAVVTLQHQDGLYTYRQGERTGTRQPPCEGLASMGLVEQIAEVRSAGQRMGAVELDGVQHYRFFYIHPDTPGSAAIVFLSARTGLPQIWNSFVALEDGSLSQAQLVYRNLEANVDLPDQLFALPEEVRFEEK